MALTRETGVPVWTGKRAASFPVLPYARDGGCADAPLDREYQGRQYQSPGVGLAMGWTGDIGAEDGTGGSEAGPAIQNGGAATVPAAADARSDAPACSPPPEKYLGKRLSIWQERLQVQDC